MATIVLGMFISGGRLIEKVEYSSELDTHQVIEDLVHQHSYHPAIVVYRD